MLVLFISILIYLALLIQNFVSFRKIIKFQSLDAALYYEQNEFVNKLIRKYGLIGAMLISFALFIGLVSFIALLPTFTMVSIEISSYIIAYITGFFSLNLLHDIEEQKKIEKTFKPLRQTYIS